MRDGDTVGSESVNELDTGSTARTTEQPTVRVASEPVSICSWSQRSNSSTFSSRTSTMAASRPSERTYVGPLTFSGDGVPPFTNAFEVREQLLLRRDRLLRLGRKPTGVEYLLDMRVRVFGENDLPRGRTVSVEQLAVDEERRRLGVVRLVVQRDGPSVLLHCEVRLELFLVGEFGDDPLRDLPLCVVLFPRVVAEVVELQADAVGAVLPDDVSVVGERPEVVVNRALAESGLRREFGHRGTVVRDKEFEELEGPSGGL
jgi:hypothetical protein